MMRSSNAPTLKDIFVATKPRLVLGNLLFVAAGYVFGADHFIAIDFILVVLGSYFMMAGACVINNVIDHDIDKKMKRTKNRPTSQVSVNLNYYIAAAACLFLGGAISLWRVNLMVLLLGIASFFLYGFIYTISKTKTPYSTHIGGVPGSIPPVAGYVAATGNLDITAIILFFIMYAWQIPHFFALAIAKRDEYAAAGIRIMPTVRSLQRTHTEMVLFCAAYTFLLSFLIVRQDQNIIAAIIVGALNIYWLYCAINNPADYGKKWAFRIFKLSLYSLLMFSAVLFVL